MRTVLGILVAAVGLAGTVLAFQPHAGETSALSLVAAILIAAAAVIVTRQAAGWWEWVAIQRRADWLREAEASKYHVTPMGTDA